MDLWNLRVKERSTNNHLHHRHQVNYSGAIIKIKIKIPLNTYKSIGEQASGRKRKSDELVESPRKRKKREQPSTPVRHVLHGTVVEHSPAVAVSVKYFKLIQVLTENTLVGSCEAPTWFQAQYSLSLAFNEKGGKECGQTKL